MKYFFKNYLIELLSTKNKEINSNLIVIYDAMAIVCSVLSEKTWEPLVKAFGLQEAEVTVLILIAAIKNFP